VLDDEQNTVHYCVMTARKHIPFPTISPGVTYMGTSNLRTLNRSSLMSMKGPKIVLDPSNQPMAVIVPYDQYMRMQEIVEQFNQGDESEKAQNR